MLILLDFPVLWAVARTHEYLQAYAPTNVLTRKIRCSSPTWEKVLGLPLLTLTLLAITRGLAEAVATGAPSWFNLVVLILAWDTIKVGCVTIGVQVSSIAQLCRRDPHDDPDRVPDGSDAVVVSQTERSSVRNRPR